MPGAFYLATLGCPKNEVDSSKLRGRLLAQGYAEASSSDDADLVVVNTCAFIEAAREESVETILELSAARKPGAKLAVTGCLAERYGEELAEAMPEIDVVAGFGEEVSPERSQGAPQYRSSAAAAPVRLVSRAEIPSFDLLELPRPRQESPFAYVKVAEGCDRRCGFCAIPSFRGRQRSRHIDSVLDEVDSLRVSEVVLVAQDLASYGHDRSRRSPLEAPPGGVPGIVELLEAVAARVHRVRLLYVYPSSLSDRLIDAIAATSVPYFDLSLQHASKPLLRAMRRPGSRERFMERIERIRHAAPGAALRSSFILGYPGETEADHDELLSFLGEAQLDWGGFFTFSLEEGTLAASLPLQVPEELALERLLECSELQETITARRRVELVGSDVEVLVDEPGMARSYREAPAIDGVVRVPSFVPAGEILTVRVLDAEGPDLIAEPWSVGAGGTKAAGAPAFASTGQAVT